MSKHTHSSPANFDHAAYPIIAQHFFGIEPPRSSTVVTADAVADLRFRRRVDRLRRLGPRVEAAGGDEFWQPPLHGVER